MSKISKIWKDPRSVLRRILSRVNFSWMPDEPYLKLMYYAHLGRKLDLKNPASCTEKIQWLKLYDRKSRYAAMVDKYEAKKVIAEAIGEEYIVPNLGIWDHPQDIDFDSLPERFVLKATHDSGTVVVCIDKSQLNISDVKNKLSRALEQDYYYWGREWPYKNVKPRIIAEEYLEDTQTKELRDYKWYCFQGVPKLMAIFCGRQAGATTADYFDGCFRHEDMTWGYPIAERIPEKPASFEKMKELAAKLSEDVPFLRVDFYEVNGKPYVGELTFFDGSGFDVIEPSEWDTIIGDWITLPEPTGNKD